MAQRMARICLFTFFLFSQFLLTSLTSSQVVASVFVLIDAQRDLEEIETFEEVESQFASQFAAERFASTDCQICDRAQLWDEVYDGIPLQKFGLRYLKSDVPPAPRSWAARESALGTNLAPAKVEPIVGDSGEAQLDEVAQFHGQLNSRPVWKATSAFLAARRTNLNEVVDATKYNVEGFCSWADQQIQFAQSQIGSSDLENPKPVEEFASKELPALITGAETPAILVPDADEPIWLKPIATRQIPMFQVADIADIEDGLQVDAQKPEVPLESMASVSIPMFFVADNEVAELEPESSLISEDVSNQDVFINETNAPKSIEPWKSDRDPYWEYYDDCDRWGVDFAKLTLEAQLEPAKESDGSRTDSASKSNHQNRASLTAVGSPLLIHNALFANARSTWVLSLAAESELVAKPMMQMWREVLDQSEFRLVEEQQHEAILFRPQPQSPFVAAVLLGKPLCYRLDVRASDLVGMLSASSLSYRIGAIQTQYADQIRQLSARSEAMRLSQRSQSLRLIAIRCRQLADSLDRFADSILVGSDDVAIVADQGKPTATK